MNGWFTLHRRIIALVVVGAIAAALVPAVAGRGDGEYQRGYAEALAAAHVRKIASLDSVIAVQRPEVVRTKVVYLASRRAATEAVERLPPAQIVGDTVTISAVPYVVPSPVAHLIEAQQATIAAHVAALRNADAVIEAQTKLVGTVTERLATADSLSEIYEREANRKPGFLSRVWNRVKTPLAFTAGASLGYVVARVVP